MEFKITAKAKPDSAPVILLTDCKQRAEQFEALLRASGRWAEVKREGRMNG